MASLKLYYQREMPQKAKMCFHVWRQSSYFCLSGLLALPRKEFFAYVSEVSYSLTMEEVEPRMEGWKHMKSLLNLWDSGSRRYLRRSSDLIINYQSACHSGVIIYNFCEGLPNWVWTWTIFSKLMLQRQEKREEDIRVCV